MNVSTLIAWPGDIFERFQKNLVAETEIAYRAKLRGLLSEIDACRQMHVKVAESQRIEPHTIDAEYTVEAQP